MCMGFANHGVSYYTGPPAAVHTLLGNISRAQPISPHDMHSNLLALVCILIAGAALSTMVAMALRVNRARSRRQRDSEAAELAEAARELLASTPGQTPRRSGGAEFSSGHSRVIIESPLALPSLATTL